MRTTFSTALAFTALFALGSGCAATSQPPAEKPAGEAAGQGAGSGGDTAGDEASNPPAAEAPAGCADPPAGSVVDVSVSELKGLIDARSNIAVVDVREPSETAEGTIADALLYPWTSKVLQASHDELPTDRPIYVICRSGSRSAAATSFLAKNGHACIHNIEGGMNAWLAASYPVAKK